MDYIICHYSEIALKGKNRSFFERRLMENIKEKLEPDFFSSAKRVSGRILIVLTAKGCANKEKISERISHVLGLSNFSFASGVSRSMEAIKKGVIKMLKNEDFKTFKISSKRSDKRFPLSSQNINEKIGEAVLKEFGGAKVKLNNPDTTCFIEIVEDNALIFVEKIRGLGGLPVGSSGKAVVLISGGIDSPVAGFEAMKRGVKPIYIHFHSYPETSESSIDKVKELIGVLSKFQGAAKLFLVPFSEIQKEIFLNCLPKLRIILYRRMMFKIADIIAQKERCEAIITGESIGQVASQTLKNMSAIKVGTEKMVLSPLICENKDDIIKKAKKIGTYKISILPHDDCCSRFLPRSPETGARKEDVLREEKKIDTRKLTEEGVKEAKAIFIDSGERN